MLKKVVFLVAVLSGAANAETLTCPVGGERFEAPDIAVCGEYAGQTMLLMSVGCPPDTLPQCPQNFLPMYRAFSEAELSLLKHYMQTESYESNVDFSPYYLAFIIEKFLNGPNERLPEWLLLRGLWQDPALISSDLEYMAALAGEMGAGLVVSDIEEAANKLALLAFVKLLRGDETAGRQYLEWAERAGATTTQTLGYLDAVRACFINPSAAHCNATAVIPQP